MEISVTGTDLARPEVKKIGYANAYEISFSRFSLFSSQTLYWKALKPHDLFHFNTQRIQVLWNHIAVLIALLTHRTLTQSKYRRTFLRLPVKMKPFLCLLIQMDLHADLYTMSSPTRHLNTIRTTQTKIFVKFK